MFAINNPKLGVKNSRLEQLGKVDASNFRSYKGLKALRVNASQNYSTSLRRWRIPNMERQCYLPPNASELAQS